MTTLPLQRPLQFYSSVWLSIAILSEFQTTNLFKVAEQICYLLKSHMWVSETFYQYHLSQNLYQMSNFSFCSCCEWNQINPLVQSGKTYKVTACWYHHIRRRRPQSSIHFFLEKQVSSLAVRKENEAITDQISRYWSDIQQSLENV